MFMELRCELGSWRVFVPDAPEYNDVHAYLRGQCLGGAFGWTENIHGVVCRGYEFRDVADATRVMREAAEVWSGVVKIDSSNSIVDILIASGEALNRAHARQLLTQGAVQVRVDKQKPVRLMAK